MRGIWEKYGVFVFIFIIYKWWEGYDGYKVVFIDELRVNWCIFGDFFKLFDIYFYTVEIKGGFR